MLIKLRLYLTTLRNKCSQWFARCSYGKTVALGIVTLFFLVLTIISQAFYDHSLYHPVDVGDVQKVLWQKESYARDVLGYFQKELQRDRIEQIRSNVDLYKESLQHEVSFHIYKGDELLYWSSNLVALKSLSALDGLSPPFLKTDNSDVVVIQTFCQEYRCVALIKIKENVFPKSNDPRNRFAKAFHVSGKVVLHEPNERNTTNVNLLSGSPVFALDHFYMSDENYTLMILTIVSWFVTLIFLFMTVSSWVNVMPLLFGQHTQRIRRYKILTLLFLLGLMALIAYFRYPSCWFVNGFLSRMSYSSPVVPTISHLFLYVAFAYGIFAVFYKKWETRLLNDSYSGMALHVRIVLMKLIPFALLFLIYAMIRGLVQHSEVNLEVSYVQDLTPEALLLLLLELSWIFLYYRVLCTVRLFYADKKNSSFIIASHLVLTFVSLLVCCLTGSGTEVIFLLIVSCIILFVDLYEIYYPVSSFLYTVPLSFLFINMIVFLSYNYCAEKNRQSYRLMACKMSTKNCVYEDEIAESILKDSYDDLRQDERLSRWVEEDSLQWAEDIHEYLQGTYYRLLDDKYDLEIELCGVQTPFTIRKKNYEEVQYLNLVALSSELRTIEHTTFFVNQSEALALSYIGVLTYGANTLYLKFYRKTDYDRLSFWEHSLARSKSMGNLSSCKYKMGDLTYSEGDFHYPGQIEWTSRGRGEDFSFSLDYYTHYVHSFDEGKSCAVVSVPEQQTYIYVILITYLFAAYILVVLVLFSVKESRRRLKERGNSLLTKMQRSFVFPVIAAFLVLALTTFPFFMDQYEKASFSEMKEKATSVLQGVRQVMMTGSDLQEEKDVLLREIKGLSNVLQTDIVLYGKNGRLSLSSRPLFMSMNKRESSLILPELRFLERPELFKTEDLRSIQCYAYYTRAYNMKNECVGYLALLSDRNYNQSRNETINILVVVTDIYLFITIISVFIIWLLNKQTTKPLQKVTEQISKVRLTESNQQIEYNEEDEIGELVKQYNRMVVQLKESAEKLARSEREFAWREMARRIAHEIKNPLTPMKLSVQQCLRKRSMDPEGFDEYFQKTCAILIDQIDNLSNIATEFSSFAKAAESRCVKMDLIEKLRSTVELFENNNEDVTFSFDSDGAEHAYVWMDDRQILQIFNNLFRNAIQAIPSDRDGYVKVSARKEDAYVLVAIEDNGCGVTEEVREKMFQPNFTTKTSGMGLGLAIVKNIISSSNGDIWFESEAGKGTCFYIKLPLYVD